MKESNQNIRKCCACHKLKHKKNLVRISVEHNTKEIKINPGNFFFGRSAYVCLSKECIYESIKKNYILKSLKITSKNTQKELAEKMNTVLNNMLVLQNK